jgi:hypothetical protein
MNLWDHAELWGLKIDQETGSALGEAFKVASLPAAFPAIHPTLTRGGEILWARGEGLHQVLLLSVDPRTGEALGEPASDFPKRSAVKHWAPQGAKLYYWEPSVRWQVASHFLAFKERSVETGEERIHQVPRPDLASSSFVYSADHTRALYFARRRSGNGRAVYLFNASTRQLSELLDLDRQQIGSPQFSNDATKVAYFARSEAAKGWALRVLDIAAKSARTLTASAEWNELQWSPGDEEILFQEGDCLKSAAVDSGQTAVVACGPAQREVADRTDGLRPARWRRSLYYSWSPDGRMVVWPVIRPEERRVELWTIDRATGDHRVAWVGGGDFSSIAISPKWSPDGRFIAFNVLQKEPAEIWAMRTPLDGDEGGVLARRN